MSDPFASLAPNDPLARLLIAHQRTDTSGCHCGWAALGESHAEHVADLIRAAFHGDMAMSDPREEPTRIARAVLTTLGVAVQENLHLRTVLTDLIEELRAMHTASTDGERYCSWCGYDAGWPCHVIQAVARAEARLEETRSR